MCSATFTGVGVGRGIAIGPVATVHPPPVVSLLPTGAGASSDPGVIAPAFAAVSARLMARAQQARIAAGQDVEALRGSLDEQGGLGIPGSVPAPGAQRLTTQPAGAQHPGTQPPGTQRSGAEAAISAPPLHSASREWLPPAQPSTVASPQGVTHAADTIADMLQATAEMAQDHVLIDEAERRVKAGESPAQAVDQTIARFITAFTAAGGYLAERVTDLKSIRDRVVAELLGVPEPGVPLLTEPSVVVGMDLSPADTAAMDVRHVMAIVTEQGGPTGHTAIIARQLGIACVVRATGIFDAVHDGDQVAVDAAADEVILNPSDELHRIAAERIEAQRDLETDVEPGSTRDGSPVVLLANIGTPSDGERAAMTAAEGVGLFRTEVLYLDRATEPTFTEQVEAYERVLEAFRPGLRGPAGIDAVRRGGMVFPDGFVYGERKVTIRTLDAGADKPLPFIEQPHEDNPALGMRGYRLVRRGHELLATQLKAIAEAARRTDSEPWVMAPMVSTVDEARAFVALAHECGLGSPAPAPAEHREGDVPPSHTPASHDSPTRHPAGPDSPTRHPAGHAVATQDLPAPAMLGVMIEVPAAALLAEEIFKEVDFVSIGTNDLAQYAMAADRSSGSLTDLLDPFQPAVLRLISSVAQAGIAAGKPMGVCGESASHPLMAMVLVGMGIGGLSMAAGALPGVRFALRRHDRDTCAAMAAAALAATSAEEAREAVRALANPYVLATLAL